MKKQVLVTTLICGLVLLQGMPVLAAQTYPQSSKTTGEVEFVEKDDTEAGVTVRPGTTDPIKPEGGSNTTGSLRIEWAPDFDFGQQKISSAEEVYKAKWNMIQDADSEGNALQEDDGSGAMVDIPAYKMPAFAQVVDERGSDGAFKLSVKQTKKFTPDLVGSSNVTNAAAATVLDNTRVEFTEAQGFLTSNVGAVTDLIDLLDVSVPYVIGDTDTMIMGTKGGATATTIDGKNASIIFNDSYTAAWDKTTGTGTTQSGVQLRVPGSDKQYSGVRYEAEFTWTIEDTI